ncbi:MAG: 16S rRNA (guanine(527)-N(7))-methyltransferase RsmG [Gammaproteobacteria bacterium]
MDELGLRYGPDSLSALLRFQALLAKWNRIYNLTAIRDPEIMLSHHLLDSASASPYLYGQRVLDVGTGPGLPGIPLAILNPGHFFVLLDSNAKKTRFVRQAVLELSLTNVEVVQDRVERFKPAALFDTIITRAFAAVSEILSTTARLLTERGRLLAMRGRVPDCETAYAGYQSTLIPIRVPGIDAERHILLMCPESAEPELIR